MNYPLNNKRQDKVMNQSKRKNFSFMNKYRKIMLAQRTQRIISHESEE